MWEPSGETATSLGRVVALTSSTGGQTVTPDACGGSAPSAATDPTSTSTEATKEAATITAHERPFRWRSGSVSTKVLCLMLRDMIIAIGSSVWKAFGRRQRQSFS